MMVPLVQGKGEIIKDNHSRSSRFPSIFQQCDATVKIVNSTVPQVAIIANAKWMHTAWEKTLTLKVFLRALVSDRKCQASARTGGFVTSIFTFNHRGFWPRQALVN